MTEQKYMTVSKAMVTALLVVCYLAVPAIGYTPAGGTIWEHILWPLSHANVWHLAGNLWVLWWLKGRIYLRESYVIAVLCSFLPAMPGLWDILPIGEATDTMATCGFSGVLCAMIGVKWGTWIKSGNSIEAYGTFCKRVLPFVMLGFLIPHVNWSIHFYCLIAGVAYGRWKQLD